MKNLFLTIVTSFAIISCGSDSDIPNTNPNGGGNIGNIQISQIDFDAIITPCADQSTTITLPDPMTIMSNYIQYEATSEIYAAQQLSESMLVTFGVPLIPPSTAVYAEVDNISVFEENTAYDWKVGNDTYRYILRNQGYDVWFYKDSNFLTSGGQIVLVEQSEDCTSFQYVQYASEDDTDANQGQAIFKYIYQKDVAQTNVTFGTDLANEGSEEYHIRSLNSLGGDMTVRANNIVVRRYTWQPNGSGTYDIIEDGILVESGTWSF